MATSIFDFVVPSIEGGEISLSNYGGKKCYLVVNVACECGGLDAFQKFLWSTHHDVSSGLTVQNYDELVQLYDKVDRWNIVFYICWNIGFLAVQRRWIWDHCCSMQQLWRTRTWPQFSNTRICAREGRKVPRHRQVLVCLLIICGPNDEKMCAAGKLECWNGEKTHPLYAFLTSSIPDADGTNSKLLNF